MTVQECADFTVGLLASMGCAGLVFQFIAGGMRRVRDAGTLS